MPQNDCSCCTSDGRGIYSLNLSRVGFHPFFVENSDREGHFGVLYLTFYAVKWKNGIAGHQH